MYVFEVQSVPEQTHTASDCMIPDLYPPSGTVLIIHVSHPVGDPKIILRTPVIEHE